MRVRIGVKIRELERERGELRSRVILYKLEEREELESGVILYKLGKRDYLSFYGRDSWSL